MAGNGRRARKTKKSNSLAERTNKSSNDEASKRQRHSELPDELVRVIISQLSLKDNIRASAVCKQWKTVANSVQREEKPPWILFSKPIKDTYELYDPLSRKTYSLNLPELNGSRVCYAKDGWLLLYRRTTLTVFFYHLYTSEIIDLPRLELGGQLAAFTSAPTTPSCMVFTVGPFYDTEIPISSCHPGDSEWTYGMCGDCPTFRRECLKIVPCSNDSSFYCLTATRLLKLRSTDKRTWTSSYFPLPENFIADSALEGKHVTEQNGDIYIIDSSVPLDPMVYKLNKR